MKPSRTGRPRLPTGAFYVDESPPPVVIAGGAGFLGQALARYFAEQGREVTILSRRPASDWGRIRTVVWDGRTVGDWAGELEGVGAVINLTGRSVACLYTPENRREIIESRVNSAKAILLACQRCDEPPPVVVQASSLAIYGDAGDVICDEDSPHGTDFSAKVCEAWEKALFDDYLGPRRVALRIGLVLGRDGGALKPLADLTRWFLGGSAGNGRQYLSWLHIEDFCRMVRWAIEHPEARGAYNATGSSPVTNKEFMRDLREALHRPWSPPTPVWAVKFGARHIMKVDPSLILTGRRCLPRRLLTEGFKLKHNTLLLTLREMTWVQKNV
ncbi:MAG: TIGR01777 family oxidoreductase [Opitutaceae bacterium]